MAKSRARLQILVVSSCLSVISFLLVSVTPSVAQLPEKPSTIVIEEDVPSSEAAPSPVPTVTNPGKPSSATTATTEEQPVTKKPKPTKAAKTENKATSHKRVASRRKIRPVPAEPVDVVLPIVRDSWAYTAASSHSAHAKRIHAGRYVHVTGLTPYFLRVQLRDGRTAYVDPEVVRLVVPTDKILTLATDSPVRERPNQWAKELAEVHKGHHVQVVGVAPNYVRIRMRSGLEGYIPYSALEGGAASLPPVDFTSTN